MGHGFRFALQSAPQDQQQWVAVARRAEQLGYSALLMPDGLQCRRRYPRWPSRPGGCPGLLVHHRERQLHRAVRPGGRAAGRALSATAGGASDIPAADGGGPASGPLPTRRPGSTSGADAARLPDITPVPRPGRPDCPAHDGQSGRGNPRSRPAAAYASTASGHGHTMATGDTASDPFSRSAQHGRPDPEDVPPAVATTGTTSTCCPGPTARCVRRRAAREAPFRNKRRSTNVGDAEVDA
jgi:hypothetical protein